MADVFSLMGKIAVDYSDAVSGLERVDSAAEDAASGLHSADSSADSTGGSLDALGNDADDAGNDLDNLGDDADGAASDIDDLGNDADGAASDIDDLGSSADSAASDVDDLGDDADSASSDVDDLGSSADSAASDLDTLASSASGTSSDLSGLTEGTEGLADGFSSATGMGGELSGVLQAFVTGGIIAGVTAAVSALISQIAEMVTGFEDAKETIALGTGATGDALIDMTNVAQDSYSKIAKASTTSCDDVAATLAELNTRFGLTGDELGDMTVKMQNFADVTGQDGVDAVDGIANMTHYWGVESDEIPGVLDDIVTASQGCQASAGDLENAMTEGAGAFQAMGYSTEEAIAFLWEYSDTGGDVSEVTQAMTKANSNLADVTDDVPGAFQAAIEAIAECDTTTEALNAEVGDTGLTVEDVFGKKVAQKLAQNIQSGNSSLDEFIDKLDENDGALDDTAEAVTSTRDRFAQFGARLKSDISGVISPALQTLGNGFTDALNIMLDFCEHPIESMQNLWSNVQEKFGGIKDTISEAMDTAKGKVQDGWSDITQAYEDGGGGITGIASAAMTGVTGLWESGMDLLNTVTGGRLSDVTEAFNSKLETAKSTATEKLGTIKENFTEKMSNVSETVSEKLGNVKDFFTNHLGTADSTTTSKLGTIASTFSSKLGNADSTTSSKLGTILSTFTSKLGSADTTTSSKLGTIASTFTSKLQSAYSTTSTKMESIKNAFSTKMETAKSKVGTAIETIRSKFNFSWSLPSLKMPHISISGSFSLNPPSAPHFSISWYKKAMEDGMILNDPTIFGFDSKTNQFLGGGEAGSETVVGTDSLMNMISSAAGNGNAEIAQRLDVLIDLLQDYCPEALERADKAVVLDSGALVGEVISDVDKELGKLGTKKARGAA